MIAFRSFCNILFGLSSLLILLTCQPEEKPIVVKETAPSTDTIRTKSQFNLLIFKEEQKLEFWEASRETIIASLELKLPSSLPIGYFKIKDFDTKIIQLNLSNEFYEGKNYGLAEFDDRFPFSPTQVQSVDLRNVSSVIIFPSDSREGQAFKPCFACPHWMAELYGRLERTLNQYIRPSKEGISN